MTEQNQALQVIELESMPVATLLRQIETIQSVMKAAMKDGQHYGKIPGCGDKPTLLKAGAEKLAFVFRMAPSFEIFETNFDGGHREYRVTCTMRQVASETHLGQGVGVCSTMEAKYRFRTGARKCPKCGNETIIKGKEQYGGGWLCFQKKGGCGAKWPDGAKEIESQATDKVENDNPADNYNTVLKMAKKRAQVDATLTCTAASDCFTQDIEDIRDNQKAYSGEPIDVESEPVKPIQQPKATSWREVKIHFGKYTGKKLGELAPEILAKWCKEWQPKPYNGAVSAQDVALRAALDASMKEPKGAEDDIPFDEPVQRDGPDKEADPKLTPQQQLEMELEHHSISFDNLRKFLAYEKLVADADSLPDIDSVPENVVLTLAKTPKLMKDLIQQFGLKPEPLRASK